MIEEALAILKELRYDKTYLWTNKAPNFYEKIRFTYEYDAEKNEGGIGRLYFKKIK